MRLVLSGVGAAACCQWCGVRARNPCRGTCVTGMEHVYKRVSGAGEPPGPMAAATSVPHQCCCCLLVTALAPLMLLLAALVSRVSPEC